MRVRVESFLGIDAILVDDTKRAIGSVIGVMVRSEGEGVECFEPAVVGVSSVLAETRYELDRLCCHL